jgi:phosphatidylserine/phosphatidylglycerophosphate/cardiolipin synthase-like enzyme
MFTWDFKSPFARVHQKLLVCDSTVGYCGGLNIGNDYASVEIGGTGRFSDIHCKIMGPAVHSLEDTFFQTLMLSDVDWNASLVSLSNNSSPSSKKEKTIQHLRHYKEIVLRKARTLKTRVSGRFIQMNSFLHAQRKRDQLREMSLGNTNNTGEKRKFLGYPNRIFLRSKNLGQKILKKKKSLVQVLHSYNKNEHVKFEIQKAYLNAIRNATNSIRISTPYFMPPPPVAKMLEDAALRGVEVQILTQGKSDRPIMFWAAQHAYYKYLKKGIRIHEMLDSELHAKTVEIDGYYCNIGSDNLDHISWGYNLEAKVEIYDEAVAKQLRDNFAMNIATAREVSLDYMNARRFPFLLLSYVAYQCYHIVYPWRISHLNE